MSRTRRQKFGETGLPLNRDYELSPIPEAWQNLSEVQAPPPVQDPNESPLAEHSFLEDEVSSHRASFRHSNPTIQETEDGSQEAYSAPFNVANLTKAIPHAVLENPEEARHYSHHHLEEALCRADDPSSSQNTTLQGCGRPTGSYNIETESNLRQPPMQVGKVDTNIYIYSHLIFFSIMGTLARLGLTALTTYPADLIRYGSIWPNFAGTIMIGFLSEGAELLHHPASARSIARPRLQVPENTILNASDISQSSELLEANEAPQKPIVPVPLFIGLSTGFCGSFTSFSAFMRDCFVALSWLLSSPSLHSSPGQDFMSVTAVLIITVAICTAALKIGAHLAILLKTFNSKLSRRVVRCFDHIVLIFGVGSWAGVIIMCIIPPDRFKIEETWRGHALFALAFAPVGCLLRFFASIKLNSRIVGFPLGTFCVNMLGTLVLALVWDLQRIPNRSLITHISGSIIACQVLKGIEDGFCGCLTTVSTWILELSALRRKHAYIYGAMSLFVASIIVVTVMGTLKWTTGLSQPVCTSL